VKSYITPSAYARDGMRDVGSCDPCGGKKIHLSRRVARRAARLTVSDDGRPRAYRCPHVDGHWHVGHLPEAVLHGRIDRDRYTQTLRGAR